MDFNFDECRAVLHRSLMDALSEHSQAIRELNSAERLMAISYDILPWDPYIGVAFRLESETGTDPPLGPADWQHSHFIEDLDCPALHPARDYTQQLYTEIGGGGGTSAQEIAHLIYLAAADAILDESVATLLESAGVQAPFVGSSLPWGHSFTYMVLDEDKVIKANYCEIVVANRVAQRLLGRIP
jgi:hypothetical protein